MPYKDMCICSKCCFFNCVYDVITKEVSLLITFCVKKIVNLFWTLWVRWKFMNSNQHLWFKIFLLPCTNWVVLKVACYQFKEDAKYKFTEIKCYVGENLITAVIFKMGTVKCTKEISISKHCDILSSFSLQL